MSTGDLLRLVPVLVPIVLIELGLMVVALCDVLRRAKTRALPKWAWIAVIVFVNVLGPLAYFLVGREEEE